MMHMDTDTSAMHQHVQRSQCNTTYSDDNIIIIIIINEFHRDASLKQNFRAAVCHVLH